MADIGPVSQSHAAALDNRSAAFNRRAASTSTPSRGADSVELSNAAQLLSKVAELPDIREDLVNQVKAEIAAGTYETDEKIDAAIDGLISEELI